LRNRLRAKYDSRKYPATNGIMLWLNESPMNSSLGAVGRPGVPRSGVPVGPTKRVLGKPDELGPVSVLGISATCRANTGANGFIS